MPTPRRLDWTLSDVFDAEFALHSYQRVALSSTESFVPFFFSLSKRSYVIPSALTAMADTKLHS